MRLDELSNDELFRLCEDFLAFCDAFGIPLFPWQRDAFGGATRREAGRFLHPLGGISVPRGDGKSWGGAAVGAWRFRLGPQPQEVVSVALDYDGAKVIVEHAKTILRSHPDLEAGLDFRADGILNTETGSWWRIKSREHTSSRGLHPHLVLYDEVGWAKDDELFASLLAAQASVRDPLFLVTSTMGRRRSGPLWTLQRMAHEDGVLA
jgi:phage terminase large subunit-like protein